MTAQIILTDDTSPIVNDVTGLNPVQVRAVLRPTSSEEVSTALRQSNGPISIGGGRFSMGGQAASPDSLHIDMRGMNKVIEFSAEQRFIRVETGIRWCDIQHFIDPYGLAIKIMQTYANFTVGGALSVNCHGRYVGLGPVILSVRSIAVVLANGSMVRASRAENSELFFGAIGGYGGLGIIVEAELDLVENTRVARVSTKMKTANYAAHFHAHIRKAQKVIFHNGDLYPPHYESIRAVSWVETENPTTHHGRLQSQPSSRALGRYAMWAISETPLGRWRREHIYEPLLYLRRRVHWRNHEAGYDVAELEPGSRSITTYVLQEYFVPVERFDEFVPLMRDILRRHTVNVINISIRHALADPGSLLAWARCETFAFVLYYKQRTDAAAKAKVAIWTRELIDAALEVGGTYYLPYQPHATFEQFLAAYPRAKEFFALKRRLDPEFRFRNSLWNKYYSDTVAEPAIPVPPIRSDFHAVYSDDRRRDAFHSFLRNVFHLFPEDRFHALIMEACSTNPNDETIYRQVQDRLGTIKPPLADLFYGLPALLIQKREMAEQTGKLLSHFKRIDGYVEIGTTGRYANALRKRLNLSGAVFLVNDATPSMSPADIVERGQFRNLGTFIPLNDYAPIPRSCIPDESVDLVTCYIGLHHCEPDRLNPFLASIHRILKTGGVFVLRDHDVVSDAMDSFVSLAHTVFNAGLGVPWETNRHEPRYFATVASWSERIVAQGFADNGDRIAQAGDPTKNLLMAFVKDRAKTS